MEVYMSLGPHLRTYSVAIGCWPWWNTWKNPHRAAPPLTLPPRITFTLRITLCAVVYCTRHLIFWLLIQKRGSRKGSIEIKKIRCVEKVNLEEQTPVERQYPFQVRGETGTTVCWADGFCLTISDYELNIWPITKDVAKCRRPWQSFLTRPQMEAGHFAGILSTHLLSLEGEKERWATVAWLALGPHNLSPNITKHFQGVTKCQTRYKEANAILVPKAFPEH